MAAAGSPGDLNDHRRADVVCIGTAADLMCENQ
jgi:hypothetical protein